MIHSPSSTTPAEWSPAGPSSGPPEAAIPDLDVAAVDVAAIVGWRPSARARRAEALAQIVLDDDTVATPLRALVRRAADLTGAENAQISLLSTRQIAIAVQQGSRAARKKVIAPSDGDSAPLEDTVCAVSIRADAPICIPDTRRDNRVASLPAVVAGAVGAYLGSPIHVLDGSVVGVLCAYDRGPHDWTTADERELTVLAAEIGSVFDRIQPVEAS